MTDCVCAGFVSLAHQPAPNNSALVDILESLGAVIIAKTNVPQTLMVGTLTPYHSPCSI